MASILFNHRFPSLTLSASTPVISEQKKSNDLLILDPQQEVIFERKINASYIFESRDKSISFPLNLHAFLKQLVIDLEVGGIEIERLPLVGSQMVDVLLENERPHNDIDFLVLIRKGKNLSQIRAIFLKLLFKFSGIETENLSDGKVLCILKDQRILKVDKAEDVFAQGALDALGMYGNIMPITIPLIGFKIDITFAWDLDSSCLLSSNCFQGDLLPFLKGMGGLNTVMAADGYDAQRSLNLLISGFFYVLPGHPSKLRDGLRGYIHAITSGIFPGDYGIEKEFLEKWLQEYPTVDRKIIFLSNLIKHFEKHYRTEPFSTSAYLINLRTFFASKEFEEKDAWLISFDMFVWPQVGTPKILETILFWHFSENPIKCRLDCVTNSSPTRFRVLLPFGALLIEAPWVESLSLLTSKKPSTIPSYFQNLFSENTILSRLALIQTPEVPLAKLLTYLVKLNLKQFIQEFACNLKYIQPNQINQLEQLFFKLMPKSAFQLKANALEFLKFASKAGHLAHAKAALGKIVIPTNLSVDENDIVFSIATDIESWKSLAKRAPNILIAHLLNLPPSKELFDQIAALSLPKVAWKNNWVDFIGQNPNLFEQFLNLSCFKSLHMEVAQKLLQSLEKSRVAWEFLFEQQPSQLPPSLELLTKVKTFPVKQWPSSWIDFIEQNPTLLERFVQTPTFGSGFHIKATDRLLKVSDFFHMAWQIGCANGSILEEHKEILTRMKKASPQEITSFTNGLLQLFEANDVLALKWSRIFFKTAPFSVLEKNLSSIPNCWRLLQLATKQTIRSSPLLIKEQLNYLKTVLKSEDDLLILVSNLIKNDSLTVYHRTELVSDLFVFMRFLQPQQQIAGKATFVQNFFTLIITLFEDPLFMEKRKRIVDLLSSFSGNVIQLPLFLKSIDKPFNECLAPLAADLQHSDEMLRYFVHWLVLAQHSNNEAKTILESLSKTLTKEQVFPADAIMIMEAFDQLSDQLVEQALSREPNPKLLLSFLESQKVTSPFLKQFEMLALTIKDWNFAIRLALQIKRLGCKDLIPEILSNKVLFTSEHLPLLQEVVFDGIHAELVWKTALPSFTDRNVHFQLQLASLCSKANRKTVHPIETHFTASLKRKHPIFPILELVESEFVQLETIWPAIKPHIKDQKIFKGLRKRISTSFNYKLNIKILLEIGEAAAAILDLQIEKIAELPPINFWEALDPLLKGEQITGRVWLKISSLSQKGFLKHKQDEETLRFIPKLVKLITASPVNQVVAAIFLAEIVECTGMIQSDSIPIDQTWSVVRYLPNYRTSLNAFFVRLVKSTDFKMNFDLLAQILQVFHPIFLENIPSKLFNHCIPQMKDLSPKDFWGMLDSIMVLKGLHTLIPESDFEKTFDITLDAIRKNETQEENVKFILHIGRKLHNSGFWTEKTLLFLVRGLDMSIKTSTTAARAAWEYLVLLAPNTMKTSEKQKEAGVFFLSIFHKLQKNTILQITSEFFKHFTWTQTPLLTRLDLLFSLNELMQNPPKDFSKVWLERWSQLTRVHWELEDYPLLISLLQKVFTLGDYSLAVTSQFMLNFEVGRHINGNSNAQNPTKFRNLISQLHQASLEFYQYHPKLLEEDQKGSEFIYATEFNEFITQSTARVQNKAIVCALPIKLPRSYLLLRSSCLHATILDLGRNEEQWSYDAIPHYGSLGKALLERLIKYEFFNCYEQMAFNTLFQELFEIFAKGTFDDMAYIPTVLTHLVKNHKLFKTLTTNEKRSFYATFITDILKSEGSPHLKNKVAYEFTREALKIPEWELILELGTIQLANFQFLVNFNQFSDVENALQSAENLLPMLRKYYVNHELLLAELAEKNATNSPELGFYETLFTLIDATIKDQSIELTIQKALKIPKIVKKAKALEAKLNEFKKSFLHKKNLPMAKRF